MDQKEIKSLVNKLNYYRDEYYNGNAIISDKQFDILEDKLQSQDPNNKYFLQIGFKGTGSKKIIHNIPMKSMDKVNSIDQLKSWVNKIDVSDDMIFVGMPKIDGMSATCKYKNGELVTVATRGNGIIGNQINYFDKLKCIPNKIPFKESVEIRGELYLSRLDKEFKGKALRNNVVGILNRKDLTDYIKNVKFVAYDIIKDNHPTSFNEKLNLLKNIKKLNVINKSLVWFNNTKKNITSIVDFISMIETNKNNFDFEIDGIIFQVDDISLYEDINANYETNKFNIYNIAYKFKDNKYYTKIIDIEWNISRLGRLIPIGILEPIRIDGVEISRATLNNVANVMNLHLGPNDTISIIRANQVIPEIISVVRKNRSNIQFDIPRLCPSCKNKLKENSVHYVCTSKVCKEKNIEQILYWVYKSGMKNIGEGIIKDLYNNNLIKSIIDLYDLEYEQILQLEGYQEKRAKLIIDEIQSSRFMSHIKMIDCIGIPLVGEKTLNKLGIKKLDDLLSYKKGEFKRNSGYLIENSISEWLTDENYTMLKNISSKLILNKKRRKKYKGSIAITGTFKESRESLIKQINKLNYEYSPTITKNTTYILCPKKNITSSKITKAIRYNIKIINNLNSL